VLALFTSDFLKYLPACSWKGSYRPIIYIAPYFWWQLGLGYLVQLFWKFILFCLGIWIGILWITEFCDVSQKIKDAFSSKALDLCDGIMACQLLVMYCMLHFKFFF
jgi:hypothetical protein